MSAFGGEADMTVMGRHQLRCRLHHVIKSAAPTSTTAPSAAERAADHCIDYIWHCGPSATHQALSILYQPWRFSSSYSLNVGLLGGH
jgi:hypothetical protein